MSEKPEEPKVEEESKPENDKCIFCGKEIKVPGKNSRIIIQHRLNWEKVYLCCNECKGEVRELLDSCAEKGMIIVVEKEVIE